MFCLKNTGCKEVCFIALFHTLLPSKYLERLREEVVTTTPPNKEQVPEFRFLLTGPPSAGKSSFVNTVSSAISGRIRQPAMVGISQPGTTQQVGIYLRNSEILYFLYYTQNCFSKRTLP